MRGDFSRFSHQPGKHYAAVLMQQGRVTLDADHNEAADILDQRWRRQTIDTIGACGVPRHHPGFEVRPTPDGTDLRISRGRLYVDGILCELDREIGYLDQPDRPAPLPEALDPVEGRTDLVFVDVWRRHVTTIEDPDLREVALGGPDTATRVRTVAQVRVLKGFRGTGCSGKDPEYDRLTAPSAGRMSAQAEPVRDPGNPCLPTPGAGFRGLENRLYRVEVHKPGAAGTATFVWSRDNGSILASVDKFDSGTEIRVGSLGRDKALGFREGDRVEVLSDLTELAGTRGTMAKVVGVDGVRRKLTLSADVSAHDVGPKFRPRVRRWDQATDPIPIPNTPGTWIELEDGVEVSFSGGPFRTGDAWVIPARKATAQVEGFRDQPPRFITHHYCRLALLTWAKDDKGKWGATKVEPCARRFPPLTELPSGTSCCDVTVGDDTATADFADLQAAVDSLSDGGRVCVLPGTYRLEAPVAVRQDGLTIAGCGDRTRVVAPSGAPAFVVEGCGHVTLADLEVQADASETAVQATGCEALTVEDCRLAGRWGLSLQAIGARVAGNRLSGGGLWVREGSADVLVEGNTVADGRGPGVALGGLAGNEGPSDRGAGVVRTTVAGNRIERMEGSGITTVAAGGDELAGVRGLTIGRNEIRSCARRPADARFEPQAVGGITLRDVASVRIHDNLVAGNGAGAGRACGIFVHTGRDLRAWGNLVTGNGTSGAEDAAAVYQGGMVALLVLGATAIHDNVVVTPAGQALLAVGLGPLSVAGNTLVANDLAGQPFVPSRAGGAVFILDVGRTPVLSDAAIRFGAAVGTSLARCRLENDALVAPPPRTGPLLPDGRVLFHGNQVTLRVPEIGVDPPSGAVTVASTDSAALEDNQLLTEVGDGMIWAGTQAYAPVLHVADNRFTETPCRAVFSCVSAGSAVIVADNQATHCLAVTGSQTVDRDNQVLLAADCERITAALTGGQ